MSNYTLNYNILDLYIISLINKIINQKLSNFISDYSYNSIICL
jgi:hypothetical protein